MTKALPKLALRLVIYKVALDSGRSCYTFGVGYLSYAPTTPAAHGTITGAEGCEFRYHSGYLSLKFNLGFSSWIQNTTREYISHEGKGKLV